MTYSQSLSLSSSSCGTIPAVRRVAQSASCRRPAGEHEPAGRHARPLSEEKEEACKQEACEQETEEESEVKEEETEGSHASSSSSLRRSATCGAEGAAEGQMGIEGRGVSVRACSGVDAAHLGVCAVVGASRRARPPECWTAQTLEV